MPCGEVGLAVTAGWRGASPLQPAGQRTGHQAGQRRGRSVRRVALLSMLLFTSGVGVRSLQAQSDRACVALAATHLPRRHFVTPSAVLAPRPGERLILGSWGYDFGADSLPRTSLREDSVAGLWLRAGRLRVIERPAGAAEFEEPHPIARADGDVDVLWFVTTPIDSSGIVQALEGWTGRLGATGWSRVTRLFAETTTAVIGRRSSSGVVQVGDDHLVAFAGSGRGPARGVVNLIWYRAGRWRLEQVRTDVGTTGVVSVAAVGGTLALVFDAGGPDQAARRAAGEEYLSGIRLMLRGPDGRWGPQRLLVDPQRETIWTPRVARAGDAFLLFWLAEQGSTSLRWASLSRAGVLGEIREDADVRDFTWVPWESGVLLSAVDAGGEARLLSLDSAGFAPQRSSASPGDVLPTLFTAEGRVFALQVEMRNDPQKPWVQVSLHDITCRLRPR